MKKGSAITSFRDLQFKKSPICSNAPKEWWVTAHFSYHVKDQLSCA